MNQPKGRGSTIRSGRGRQGLLLGMLLLLLSIGHGRASAADAWLSADDASNAGNGGLPSEPLPRVPPVELASYDVQTVAEPACTSESYLGYDRGFVMADAGAEGVSEGGFPFFLRVNSWVQLRYTVFDAEDPSQDLNLFSLERLRLGLGGHAYSPSLGYFLQLDGNSDEASDAVFLDYFVTYDLGCECFDSEAGKLGIKAGKWKVPFSRTREESGRLLQFTERSTANLFFDLNRSIGVGLFGELAPWSTPIRWETALFNGFQVGADTDVSDSGLDRNFAWSARIYADLFGEFGADDEPDLAWHAEPALRVGGGLAATRVAADGIDEFDQPRVVDSGATLASLLPPQVSAYDIGLSTIDAHWKHRGLSVIAEYYWRCLAAFEGGEIPCLSDHGFNLQVGQFVIPARLELLARWSRIVGNSGTLGAMSESTDEVGLGAAWYLYGHNAKLVVDASRMNGMAVSSPRLDIPPGAEGWLLRTQLQFGF